MSADYSQMTQSEFDSILESIVSKLTAAQILSYGGFRSILGEELNNDVLDEWASKNREKAYPEIHDPHEPREYNDADGVDTMMNQG